MATTRGALDDFSTALCALFDAFFATSPGASVVAVEQPHLLDYSRHAPHDQGSNQVIDRYNVRQREVADGVPAVVVVAVIARWEARSMLAGDTVHPNDAGHAEVGRTVAEAYRSASWPMATTRPVHDWGTAPSP